MKENSNLRGRHNVAPLLQGKRTYINNTGGVEALTQGLIEGTKEKGWNAVFGVRTVALNKHLIKIF